MIETASLNANELVAKLKTGEISSVDLCKAYIKRIEKFEKDVQAWEFLDKRYSLRKLKKLTIIESQVNQLVLYMVFLWQSKILLELMICQPNVEQFSEKKCQALRI